MKILLILSLAFCVGLIGYHAGLRQQLSQEKAIIQELASSEKRPASQSLAYGIAVIAEEEMQSKGMPVGDVTTIEKTLDNLTISSDEEELRKILGPDESKLWRALVAERHIRDVPGSDRFVRKYVQELLAQPNESTAKLGKAMDRIPSLSYPLEKAALLLLMQEMPGSATEVKARGLAEMTQSIVRSPSAGGTGSQNASKSTSSEMLLPSIAQTVYLSHVSDAQEALAGTVQGIAAQQDAKVRSTLAAQLLQKYPELQAKLTAALGVQGIQIGGMGHP